MIDAYKRFWKNYVNFNGRSTRSDYWFVILDNFIIGFVLGLLVAFVPKLAFLSTLYSLVALIPGIALVIRRLHDINKSGWTYLMLLIPLVGWIIMLVFLCMPSVNENNKYGERA